MIPQALVDFNEVEEDDRVYAFRRNVDPSVDLSPGSRLLVGDRTGNVCKAEVVDVTGDLVEMILDSNTFRRAGDGRGAETNSLTFV